MKENVFENPVEVRSTVSPPRFDDQRVVQRAQRVVPLDEIRTKTRLRRIWFLGGAFAIALVLGAASALVAVYIKRASATATSQIQLTTNTQPEPNTTATPETVAAQSDPQMEPASLVDEETPEEETPEDKAEVKPVQKQTPPVQRPRVVAREVEPLEPRRRGVEPTEEEQLEQIRESILYERWQERRARRAERREQRRNRGGERDLTHVDELFEGPRRPRY
jgi:outer membrane biosynthesis protein TonB